MPAGGRKLARLIRDALLARARRDAARPRRWVLDRREGPPAGAEASRDATRTVAVLVPVATLVERVEDCFNDPNRELPARAAGETVTQKAARLVARLCGPRHQSPEGECAEEGEW